MEQNAGTLGSAHNTRVSDSAYSNSCSNNSQSQRSGSSNSRNFGSNSSGSRSSGYSGQTSTSMSQTRSDTVVQSQGIKRANKKGRKSTKNKKAKLCCAAMPQNTATPTTLSPAEEQNAPDNGTYENTETFDYPSDKCVVEDGVVDCIDDADATMIPITTTIAAITTTTPSILLKDSGVNTSSAELAAEDEADCASPGDDIHAAAIIVMAGNAQACVEVAAEENSQEVMENITSPNPPSECVDSDNGFVCVISMIDGVVLSTTPSITNCLGFPKDMWLGRSFIEFVRPDDRQTFLGQVASGVELPISEIKVGPFAKSAGNSVYVMFRKYRSLRVGFGLANREIIYESYHLCLSFHDMPEETISEESLHFCDSINTKKLLLRIQATLVKSAFTIPNEVFQKDASPQFSTRHTAKGLFSHIDAESVASFGYLPQEVMGRSTLDFYHPEDLENLKDVYGKVMQQDQEKEIYCSLPYRFLIKNGCYVTLETKFSSFVNPWSRELEFIVGYHRVLQGPNVPNVFAKAQQQTAGGETSAAPEDTQKAVKQLQDEILQLLSKPVPKPADIVKQQVSQRCKAMASYMETLMVAAPTELKLNLPQEPFLSFLEQGGSVIGEISPHHEYMDSKSSSETPPSYNQLNYNENLERFFNSHPVTNNFDPRHMEQLDFEHSMKMGDHNLSDSGGNLSSGSNVQMESTTNTSQTGTGGTWSDGCLPQNLTENILCRHNEDMEKTLVKNHREARSNERNEHCYRKIQDRKVRCKTNGLKRGNPSPQPPLTGHEKYMKHSHSANLSRVSGAQTNSVRDPALVSGAEHSMGGRGEATEYMPTYTMRPGNLQQASSSGITSSSSGFYPALYLLPHSSQPLEHHSLPHPIDVSAASSNVMLTSSPMSTNVAHPQQPHQLHNFQYISHLVYSPSVLPGTCAATYPQSAVMYPVHIPTLQQQEPHMAPGECYDGGMGCNFADCSLNEPLNRPSSQATSVLAEPRSNVDSIASVSFANHALSDTSRHDVCSSPANYYSDSEFPGYSHRFPDDHLISFNSVSDEEKSSSISISFGSTTSKSGGSGSLGEDSKQNWSKMSADQVKPLRRPDPYWMQNVNLTPDLTFRYQKPQLPLQEILAKDYMAMQNVEQPEAINFQLQKMVQLMRIGKLPQRITIFDSSSGSEEDDETLLNNKLKMSLLNIVHDENASIHFSKD